MAAFSDEDLTYTPADFDSALFGTRQAIPTGSVRDYYRWASGGRLDITGRVVATVRLPGTLAYYGDGKWGLSGRPGTSMYGALRDALTLCQRDVDWSEFDLDHNTKVDGVWLLHSGKGGEASADDLPQKRRLWSYTSMLSSDPGGGSFFETTQLVAGSTQHYKIDAFSCVPELSGLIPGRRSVIGVFCHEFGHLGLGLPDLYDTSNLSDVTNVGPGHWSLMSFGAYGGNGIQPEMPCHIGGWASQFLGWSQSIRPAQDTTLRLTPLTKGGSVVEFWFQGEASPEHFLLENRMFDEFDRSLLKAGMIVTHVDEGVIAQRNFPVNRVNVGPIPGLFLVEADGDNDLYLGRNKGDRFDPFPGDSFRTELDDETRPNTHTFKDAVTNIGL
jgi:immune inhibitor A